ncbi:MAG: hypothetical protein V4793_10895 [Paraburkholderia tropica]|uniref:hypothetical protein n=1 Tax=Paraburkholderia tropica TaxID=92647 RepID=UPI000D75FB20|nr:hypothetical protein [Paraburkholderia tropica]MBB3003898.1 hypothetical protein [Paraburkholderia tropica]MBB6322742.1 hypothetical protein [Paraburkholderia tropica]MDE1144162.1 hypothetical protein [Paraburkholderia tropica]
MRADTGTAHARSHVAASRRIFPTDYTFEDLLALCVELSGDRAECKAQARVPVQIAIARYAALRAELNASRAAHTRALARIAALERAQSMVTRGKISRARTGAT